MNCMSGLVSLIAFAGLVFAGETATKHYVYFEKANLVCEDTDVENACLESTVAFAKCSLGKADHDFNCTTNGWGLLFENKGLVFVPRMIWKESTLVYTIKRVSASQARRDAASAEPLTEKANKPTAKRETGPKRSQTVPISPFTEMALQLCELFQVVAPQNALECAALLGLSILVGACCLCAMLQDIRKMIPTIVYDCRAHTWHLTFAHSLQTTNVVHRAVFLFFLTRFAHMIPSGDVIYSPNERTLTIYGRGSDKQEKKEAASAVETPHS